MAGVVWLGCATGADAGAAVTGATSGTAGAAAGVGAAVAAAVGGLGLTAGAGDASGALVGAFPASWLIVRESGCVWGDGSDEEVRRRRNVDLSVRACTERHDVPTGGGVKGGPFKRRHRHSALFGPVLHPAHNSTLRMVGPGLSL